MSKETALNYATQNQPILTEVKVSPVTGIIPEKVMEEANPAVENEGALPPPMVSTQMSHLAKKEAKLLAEREAFKKEQEEFQAIKARVQEVYDKAQAFESTRKQDPIKALKELGFTEKEIIDYLAQEEAPKPSTEEIVQQELKKFKEEQEAKAKEAQKAKDQALIQEFKNQLNSVVAADPEKFELCAYHGPVAQEIMFNIALEEAKRGETPDPQSIAEEVENFYLEEFQSMGKLKKLTPREQAVLEEAKAIERTRTVHPAQDIVKPKVTTLSNKIAATTAAIAKPSNRPETREEKRARLEAMIRMGFTK